MIWFILLIIAIVCACFTCYKLGEVHELHKMRGEFEHYLEAHEAAKEYLKEGIEAAERIVDHMIDEETDF